MKVLIIGGCGYIGSAIFPKLNTKYCVDTLDLEWFGNSCNPKNIKKDYKNLSEDEISKYDVIILLAGHSSVGMCAGPFTDVVTNNLYNFTSFLEKLQKVGKRIKLIYASSSSVYGDTKSKIATEEEVNFYPHNNYDIVKYMADLAVQRYNVEYYGLRFGTVNGYSIAMRDDVMINSMISSAKKNNHIRLFGGDTCRPILGINDLYESVLKIISCEEDRRGFYNLASFNTTAKQVAYEVSRLLMVPVKIIENEPTASTYNFSISTEKFQKAFNFNFTDTITSISESIINNYSQIKLTNRKGFIKYEF